MEWPLEQWLFRHWRAELWAEVEGPEVLEIGVGTGKNISYYPEGTRFTAIDLSPKMLKRAESTAQSFPDKKRKASGNGRSGPGIPFRHV